MMHWPRERRATLTGPFVKHLLSVETRAWSVRCACGLHFVGHDVAGRASRHLEETRGRNGKRVERVAGMHGSSTTAELALRWGIGRSAAYAYLVHLRRLGAVRCCLVRGFPPRLSWEVAA